MIIRKATMEDVEQFVHHVSNLDVEEMLAREPRLDVVHSMLAHLDDNSVVCVDDEGFVYAYGGHRDDQLLGEVWFLTSQALTDATIKTKLEFTRLIRQHAEKLLETYEYLWNYVWIGNDEHKRFVKAIGAEFKPEYLPYHSPWTAERFDLFTIHREVH